MKKLLGALAIGALFTLTACEDKPEPAADPADTIADLIDTTDCADSAPADTTGPVRAATTCTIDGQQLRIFAFESREDRAAWAQQPTGPALTGDSPGIYAVTADDQAGIDAFMTAIRN